MSNAGRKGGNNIVSANNINIKVIPKKEKVKNKETPTGLLSNFFNFCKDNFIRKIIALMLLFPIAVLLIIGNTFQAILSFVVWFWIARRNCSPFIYIFLPLILFLVIFFVLGTTFAVFSNPNPEPNPVSVTASE
tara:strand:- start:580 stop:981 length:402 start_codon:yes stop_codon:yes gene_type:complete